MKEIKLNIEWKTNEYYEMNVVTLLLTDEKIETIQKSQQFLKENSDVDSIRVRVDQDYLTSDTDYKLGYGFVMVGSGDVLYFIGTDHHDSQLQVETEGFELDEEDDLPENFSELELEEFKKNWGQNHVEICANLDYDIEDADDLLVDDYFWLEDNHKWYPKDASTYSKREEKIADYLRHK